MEWELKQGYHKIGKKKSVKKFRNLLIDIKQLERLQKIFQSKLVWSNLILQTKQGNCFEVEKIELHVTYSYNGEE
jgi:hypothetical protein